MDSIKCRNCDSQMGITTRSRYNQGLGFFLLVSGAFSLLFGLPLGILMTAAGLYLCVAREDVWFCGDCKTAVPRVDI